MFDGFQDQWTPIELSRRLKKGAVLAARIAGVPIALFRRADGTVGALLDRCPHRGVALSLGKVVEDGCLECPFHGWRFDGDGTCTHIPLNPMPADKRARYNTSSLPVRDIGGLIWVYTSLDHTAAGEPHVPEAMRVKDLAFWYKTDDWSCHWTRAMENMLDSPHLPFVHRKTIGRAMRKDLTPQSRMDMQLHPDAHGFKVTWDMDGRHDDGSLRFNRPNSMVLTIPIPKRLWQNHVWCVPLDDGHTRMILVSARDFGRYNPFTRIMDEFNSVVLKEDKAIVESSNPPHVPPPAHERSVATDKATLAFRKYYYRDFVKDGSEPAELSPPADTEPSPRQLPSSSVAGVLNAPL